MTNKSETVTERDLRHPAISRYLIRDAVKDWRQRTRYGKLKMLPLLPVLAVGIPLTLVTWDLLLYVYLLWTRNKDRLPETYKEDADAE